MNSRQCEWERIPVKSGIKIEFNSHVELHFHPIILHEQSRVLFASGTNFPQFVSWLSKKHGHIQFFFYRNCRTSVPDPLFRSDPYFFSNSPNWSHHFLRSGSHNPSSLSIALNFGFE